MPDKAPGLTDFNGLNFTFKIVNKMNSKYYCDIIYLQII
jgi:hypothetical protein